MNYQYDKSIILQILRRIIRRGAAIFGLLLQVLSPHCRYRAAYLYHCRCRRSKTYHAPFSLRCYSFNNILPLAASFRRSLSSPILLISYIRCRPSVVLRFSRYAPLYYIHIFIYARTRDFKNIANLIA